MAYVLLYNKTLTVHYTVPHLAETLMLTIKMKLGESFSSAFAWPVQILTPVTHPGMMTPTLWMEREGNWANPEWTGIGMDCAIRRKVQEAFPGLMSEDSAAPWILLGNRDAFGVRFYCSFWQISLSFLNRMKYLVIFCNANTNSCQTHNEKSIIT